MIGRTLAHYRVTDALGAGGMGEVYRATDTKLGRDVAIKVLPSEVTQDPERLARFEREAKVLASLNHPNVAAIYGLEEADGKPFLVLELAEGEELKQRLERGAVPVDETIEIARQIAEGLEEAHERGIIHRDLKPANVKLTPDGKVKVLDFGLAKAWTADTTGSSADLSQSPTLAHTGTEVGVILGTAAYMSPEQARGRAVDRRTDIWAFGVVVFEMLTGRPLFRGETVTDVLAAVVREDVDWSRLRRPRSAICSAAASTATRSGGCRRSGKPGCSSRTILPPRDWSRSPQPPAADRAPGAEPGSRPVWWPRRRSSPRDGCSSRPHREGRCRSRFGTFRFPPTDAPSWTIRRSPRTGNASPTPLAIASGSATSTSSRPGRSMGARGPRPPSGRPTARTWPFVPARASSGSARRAATRASSRISREAISAGGRGAPGGHWPSP